MIKVTRIGTFAILKVFGFVHAAQGQGIKNPIFVSYILLRSLGASVHINAALFGFGTSTHGRKHHSVKPSVALGPDDFPDTTESP